MSATQQYLPIASDYYETGAPLSVRAINDFAQSVDNYAQFVGAHKTHGYITTSHNAPRHISLPYFNTTDEEYVLYAFAPRYIPSHYKYYIIGVMAALPTGFVSSHRLTVYCTDRFYRGPRIFDSSFIPNRDSYQILLTSDTMTAKVDKVQLYRNFFGMSYLLITAKSIGEGANAQSAYIYSFSAQPAVSENF